MDEEWALSPREWISFEVSVELRDRRPGGAEAGHDSITGILGTVNEMGITIEEIFADNAGEEVRIGSFIPWAAVRRITLRGDL